MFLYVKDRDMSYCSYVLKKLFKHFLEVRMFIDPSPSVKGP